jgi:hypothetical protein
VGRDGCDGQVAKLDRVMHSLREVLQAHPVLDEQGLEALPDRFRNSLGETHGPAGAAGAAAAGLGVRTKR